MKKFLSSVIIAGSMMLAAAPSQAVTGTLTYFWTNGTNIGIIVNGLFYYSNSLAPAVITSIDVARRTNNGVVNIQATSGQEIIGAY